VNQVKEHRLLVLEMHLIIGVTDRGEGVRAKKQL